MSYALKVPGGWQEMSGPFTIAGIQYPANWPALATAEERAALGISEVAESAPQPESGRVVGSQITGDDVATRIWVVEDYSLAELKEQRKAAAEVYRDQRINGGCTTPYAPVDTDPVSRANINGSVSMASILGPAFSARWRRADNSYVQLDATAMIAIGLAAGQFVAACYEASFAIKDAIDAASDAAAIAAIDIASGYPAA